MRRQRKSPQSERALKMLRQELEKIKPNGALPSERMLAEKLGVSRKTLRGVLEILKRERLINVIQGKGMFRAEDTATPLPRDLTVVLSLTDLYELNLNLVNAVVKKAERQNVKLLTQVRCTRPESQKEFLLSLLNQSQIRGLLINPPLLDANFERECEIYSELRKAGIYLVLLNAPFQDIPFDSVGFDDRLTQAMITSQLLQHNYRNPAFLAYQAFSIRQKQRIAGFKDALHSAGMAEYPVIVVHEDGFNYNSRHLVLEPLQRALDNGINAFVTNNDKVAEVVGEYLTELGIKVPDEVMVTGNDRQEHVNYHPPAGIFSSIRDRSALGATAFNLLYARMIQGDTFDFTPKQILLPAELINPFLD